MAKSLHGLAQAIYQDHLDPPAKFFLYSSVLKDEEESNSWEIKLYATVDQKTEVWTSRMAMDELPASETALHEAIQSGMLHIHMKGKKGLHKAAKLELQLLREEGEPMTIHLETSDHTDEDASTLLEATFSLLARKPSPGHQPDKAELRSLRKSITDKDEELSRLRAQVTNLRAAADSARSGEIKKKLLASPKKPVGASAMQPNAKRRKAVVDEFAGSDSD